MPSLPSPLHEIYPEVFVRNQNRLLIKREDLIHPDISGNKWRKLKYNLQEARKAGFSKLLTFGGAYSNHLAATAAAGKLYRFATTGIVRGEKVLPLNPTLQYAENCGMELVFVSRSAFRNKTEENFLQAQGIDPDIHYVIPEGGSNCLALKGVAESVAELKKQLPVPPDFVATACGTGATLAGLVTGLQGERKALGVPVLKGGFIGKEVNAFLQNCTSNSWQNWQTAEDYHFGGYAKFQPELIQFINQFKIDFNISLDPVYTGKLAFALFDLAGRGFFPKRSTIVMFHTGGLQGIAGFNERHGGLLI